MTNEREGAPFERRESQTTRLSSAPPADPAPAVGETVITGGHPGESRCRICGYAKGNALHQDRDIPKGKGPFHDIPPHRWTPLAAPPSADPAPAAGAVFWALVDERSQDGLDPACFSRGELRGFVDAIEREAAAPRAAREGEAPRVPLGVWQSCEDRAQWWEDRAVEALRLLRLAARDWEPGPGPFSVNMTVVNQIINFLAVSGEPEK